MGTSVFDSEDEVGRDVVGGVAPTQFGEMPVVFLVRGAQHRGHSVDEHGGLRVGDRGCDDNRGGNETGGHKAFHNPPAFVSASRREVARRYFLR